MNCLFCKYVVSIWFITIVFFISVGVTTDAFSQLWTVAHKVHFRRRKNEIKMGDKLAQIVIDTCNYVKVSVS